MRRRYALPLYHAGSRYYDGLRASRRVYQLVAQGRALKFSAYIAPDMRVLDYGVGSGFSIARLPCALRVGFDVASEFCDKLAEANITFCDDTSRLPDGSFDAVICHHVLEHVPEPWAALEEMHRLLVRGGRLIVHVPNENERYHRVFNRDEMHHHLYSWTSQTLGRLLEAPWFAVHSIGVVLSGDERKA